MGLINSVTSKDQYSLPNGLRGMDIDQLMMTISKFQKAVGQPASDVGAFDNF